MRSFFLSLLILLSVSVPVWAQEDNSSEIAEKSYLTLEPDAHLLKKTGTATVRAVIDALRLQLDDKRIVQLSGLDVPDLLQAEPGEIALQGKELLETLFLNKKVILYQPANPKEERTNRMGYMLAHVTRSDDHVWAQGVLLSEGLARVRTTLGSRVLASDMLSLEKKSRSLSTLLNQEIGSDSTAQKNLWMNPLYQILTPESALKAKREFQIVEGTILKAATVQNVIYLNFGRNWRDDFTIGIEPNARRLFSKEGFQPLQWVGKTVRVRGWLEDKNGPYINIDHPERIEFIETQDAVSTVDDQPKPPAKKVIQNALPNIEQPQFNR